MDFYYIYLYNLSRLMFYFLLKEKKILFIIGAAWKYAITALEIRVFSLMPQLNLFFLDNIVDWYTFLFFLTLLRNNWQI